MFQNEKPVGRIEYINQDGTVEQKEWMEFTEWPELIDTLIEEEYFGARVRAVLYRYNGETPDFPEFFSYHVTMFMPIVEWRTEDESQTAEERTGSDAD